ncbi:hypothetical protein B0H12DRAFT_853031 [Mycena haematopus]|nr:hypothetical protein B0H12DRAFT_853031 [Mycena haematopus]
MRGTSTISRPDGTNSFNAPNRETTFISSITLDEYDMFCHECFKQDQHTLISPPTAMRLGTLIHFSRSSQQKAPVKIASLPASVYPVFGPWVDETLNISNPGAKYRRGGPIVNGEDMTNKWTRCETRAGLCLNPSMSVWTVRQDVYPWLSQGNHIISQLRNPCNHEDYAIVNQVVFQLVISDSSQPIPDGYLFLCPADDFQVEPSIFRWPDCPAYWSLDPSGTNRLSTEDARLLGFPSFEMMTGIKVSSWDESVYTGVRQFQRAKGFDPYSQDAARALNHPLYRLCTDTDESFAHIDSEHSCQWVSDDEELVAIADCEADEQVEWDTCDRGEWKARMLPLYFDHKARRPRGLNSRGPRRYCPALVNLKYRTYLFSRTVSHQLATLPRLFTMMKDSFFSL